MKNNKGQFIYCGPTIRSEGLKYGTIFKGGSHSRFSRVIEQCAAIGSLFVPVEKFAEVRLELNLDIARNVRGKIGKYVTFYSAVQNWLASKAGAGVATAKP